MPRMLKVEVPLRRVCKVALWVMTGAAAAFGGSGGCSLPNPRSARTELVSGRETVLAGARTDDARTIAELIRLNVPLQRDGWGQVRWIEAARGELNDEALRHFPDLPQLEWLEIGGGNVTPAGVAHLKGCASLRRLYIHDLKLGDEVLACLSGLRNLEGLSLQHTGMTGKDLKHLGAIGSLTVLNLSDNEIADEHFAPVADLKKLEVLALQNTKITGVGLAALKGMARLNVLNLSNCRITDGDLELFASLPNLRIVWAAGCNLGEQAIRDLNERLPMLSIFR
jgi:hypothetical protein